MAEAMGMWSTLSIRRKVVVALAAVAMFVAVLAIGRLASAPSMSLLYSGLDPAAAGEVVGALEQEGVAYDVRDAAIFVDSRRRDALRMTLAGQGLPASSGQGYELLDQLTGFGTTSQMFDAAYWRAKEGELARTIASNPLVRSARVHIASQRRTPLSRASQASASVTLLTAGGTLPSSQVEALRHLVASAVSGLSPSDVSVIDSRSGLLTGRDMAANGDQRAEALRANVTRLLEARVGPGKAIVEVSLETVTEREQISERIIDPESRVAISQNVEERSGSASNAASQSVTVASNLPDGDAGGAGRDSESSDSETRETTNFEVSETRRDILKEPGALRRLSVAVLVDGTETTDDRGATTWSAREEDELSDLRELVATAVGFDEARGDTLTIKSLQFTPLPEPEPIAAPSLAASLDLMTLLQLATFAAVALFLGLFVVRPVLKSGTLSAPPALAPPAGAATVGMIGEPGAAPTTVPDGRVSVLPPSGSDTDGEDALPSESNSPAARLRKLMSDRERETMRVLNDWMGDDGRGRRP